MSTANPCRATGHGIAHSHLTRFPGGQFCVNCGYASAPGGGPYDWWCTLSGPASRATLAMVAGHLAESGADARDLVYLIEKPWKYTDEFIAAVRACAADPTG